MSDAATPDEDRPVHVDDTFSFVATGDAILTRRLAPYEGTTDRFDDLLALLREADATATNLEVIVHDYEPAPAATSGGTYMRAPPAVLDDLVAAGVDLFAAATNHTYDYGEGGVERTLAALRERDLVSAGIGRNRFEAREPGYLDTPGGRVGLVSVCTSYQPAAVAGERTAAMRGRPGLNPLGVERVYRLAPDRLDALRAVSEAAGIEAIKGAWLDRGIYYNHDWNDPSYFHFGDMKFRSTEETDGSGGAEGPTYVVSDADVESLTADVAEADANADWVVASIHTHQGAGGRQTTVETPDFLVDVAHRCVEAGADVVVGHGPHVCRGVELYRGAPVFYSLGNFVVQNETVSRLPPESYRRYGLEDPTRVSDVFDQRLYDDQGEPTGDLANRRFWQTVVPRCVFAGGDLDRVELHPVTLQRDQPRSQRGVPVVATGAEATEILDDAVSASEPFGTSITVADGVGVLDVDPVA